MRKLVSVLVVLLLAVIVLSGCMSRSKKTVYSPFGKMTVSSSSGLKGKPVTEAQLGAPVYPGAICQEVADTESNILGHKMRMHMTTLATKDPTTSVEAFYKAKYPSAQVTSQTINGQQVTTIMPSMPGSPAMPPTASAPAPPNTVTAPTPAVSPGPPQPTTVDETMIQIMSDPKGKGTMINVLKMKMKVKP